LDGSNKNEFPYRIANKFYYIETNLKVNWYQAAHNCREMGGNLLNIESSEEMDAILSILPKVPLDDSRYWISSNCLAKNSYFTSVTSGEVMPYTRWGPGEPNNETGIEFCFELLGPALNDYSCSRLIRHICEAKIMY